MHFPAAAAPAVAAPVGVVGAAVVLCLNGMRLQRSLPYHAMWPYQQVSNSAGQGFDLIEAQNLIHAHQCCN